MKALKTLLLVPLALLPASLDLPLGAAPGAPPTAPQVDHAGFRKKFGEAMKINATKEMTKLVRTQNEAAVVYILDTAEAISNQPSEELETRMAALRQAWREAMNSDFCDEMYEYFSLLEPAQKNERRRLRRRYDKSLEKYVQNLQDKDGPTFGLLGNEFSDIAGMFERVGDKYYASQCWILQGGCYRDINRGEEADNYKVYKAYDRAVKLREEIQLKDSYWVETKGFAESLARQGFSGEAPKPGEAGPGRPGEPAAKGPALTAAMGFEIVEELFDYERPMYYADELYGMWNGLYFREKGSESKFVSMDAKLSPVAHRTGSSTIELDTDKDGEPDVKIPVTGNWEPVQIEIGEGDERRPWGFLATIGIDKDTYQGIEISLIPQDQYFTLYCVPAASVVGDLAGTPVRVFDDNADGTYGSPPLAWAHTGMSAGHNQPEQDSIVVGAEKRARPWSEFVEVGGQWYQVASAKAGMELQATPVELQTGTLKLKFKGGKPTWVILKGKGKYENCYYDVAKGKAEVPAGSYDLFYGELRKGKKRQMSKSLILPGEDTPSWDVEAGGEVTVELGGPFGFDFEFERDGDTVVVKGQSVVVTGIANERYERPWFCVPRPEVSWRKAGSKKASKSEKMDAILDQDGITKHGWRAVWSPLDMTFQLKGKPEEIEVQLTEKKNRLVGKIASAWKPE